MPAEPDAGTLPQRSIDNLLDHAPCGFLSFLDDGTIDLVNATLLEMLGYQRHELAGRHVEHLMPIGTRIFYQTHWFPLLRLHGSAEEIFLLFRSKSGEDLGLLVNAVRRERGGRGVSDCVLMHVRERQKFEDELLRARRTAEQARAELEAQQVLLLEQAAELEAATEELRTMNEELLDRTEQMELAKAAAEEANQAKSDFLAVMSHELRTPLNAIAGYVDILEMGIQGPVNEAQIESLGRVRRSQRHLLRLINDVLNLARIEAGRVEYHTEDALLSEIVDEVRPMVDPQMAAKGLQFQQDVGPGVAVIVDREKLQQILLNLLSNAIKFTPEGGSISISSAAGADQTVEVSVADTGIGIPAAKLESMFEPFVQVDASGHGQGQGTGLGLAISRDLARGMGGDLTARSTEGRGSAFLLTLRRSVRT